MISHVFQSGRRISALILIAICACVLNQSETPQPVACAVTPQHKWLESSLSASFDTRYCPVSLYQHRQFKAYLIDFTASDASKLQNGSDTPGRIKFLNYLQNPIYGQADGFFYFHSSGGSSATGTASGGYWAGSDTTHGLTGSDYAKIIIHISNPWGDSAQALAVLNYAPYSSGSISGPTNGIQAQLYMFNVNDTYEFKPVTIEWFIDNVSQGSASYSNESFGASWNAAGTYTVKARVTPPEDSYFPTPYNLTVEITISEESCGGEPGQTPCTAPPAGLTPGLKANSVSPSRPKWVVRKP